MSELKVKTQNKFEKTGIENSKFESFFLSLQKVEKILRCMEIWDFFFIRTRSYEDTKLMQISSKRKLINASLFNCFALQKSADKKKNIITPLCRRISATQVVTVFWRNFGLQFFYVLLLQTV